jgi:hypothetical protein
VLFTSLEDGSYMLNVMHLESGNVRSFEDCDSSVKSKKMLCSNLFMIGWQRIIVLVFLVLWNFWTRIFFFSP